VSDVDEADRKDVADVLAGRTENYSRIVNRHGDAIARQMRTFSREAAVIDELTHEVFVEAYLNLAKFRGDAPFRHWLARIATITGYRYWKSQDREKRNVLFDQERDSPLDNPPRGDPEAAGELLSELLSELPEADRLILNFMYIEKIGLKEIARRLDCSRTAAAVRIHRAKRRLKRLGRDAKWRERVRWMIS